MEFQLLPNFRVLGPKLGKQVPACKKALAEADGAKLQAELAEKGAITVELPEGPVELGPEEIQIRLTAKEGFAAADEGGHVVVLDTHITPELERAGMAREAINRIQRVRKDRDLAFDARIAVVWSAEGELKAALEEHGGKIAEETLATRFEAGEPEGEVEETEVEGAALRFSLAVV